MDSLDVAACMRWLKKKVQKLRLDHGIRSCVADSIAVCNPVQGSPCVSIDRRLTTMETVLFYAKTPFDFEEWNGFHHRVLLIPSTISTTLHGLWTALVREMVTTENDTLSNMINSFLGAIKMKDPEWVFETPDMQFDDKPFLNILISFRLYYKRIPRSSKTGNTILRFCRPVPTSLAIAERAPTIGPHPPWYTRLTTMDPPEPMSSPSFHTHLVRHAVPNHLHARIPFPSNLADLKIADKKRSLELFSKDYCSEFMFGIIDSAHFCIASYDPHTEITTPTADLPLSNPAAVEALLKTWTPSLPDTAPFVEPFCAFMQQAVIAHLKNPRPKQYELRFTHSMEWWAYALRSIDVPEHARTHKKWVFGLLTAAVKINFRIARCEIGIHILSDSEIELIFEFTH